MFDYKLIYSRRRSIGISVSPDRGIIVRAPYRTSERRIESILLEKSGWISKHLNSFSTSKRISSDFNYTDGEQHLFQGKEVMLKITQDKLPSVSLGNEIIDLRMKETGDAEKIKKMLNKWYRKEAESFLTLKFSETIIKYSNYNFTPLCLKIRPLKSRWGSCTSKGKITLNSELIKLDEVFSEYVIVHELCHLKVHNHGKEFYRLLSEMVPDYKRIRDEMKRYITR